MSNKLATLDATAYLALFANLASTQSITLNFKYMATKKAGGFNG